MFNHTFADITAVRLERDGLLNTLSMPLGDERHDKYTPKRRTPTETKHKVIRTVTTNGGCSTITNPSQVSVPRINFLEQLN